MTKSVKKETPEQIAKLALSLIREKADPETATQAQRYFKESVKIYGLPADAVRALAKEIYARIKPFWTVEDALELCEILLPNPYLEAKGLATLLLLRYKHDFPEKLFSKIEGWLSSNYCDNWASVDSLCPNVMDSLLLRYPQLQAKIMGWPFSRNRWVRRAAAVSFIRLARRGKLLDEVYKIAESLFRDDDDLIQKANGWLLREAGKYASFRLEKFLLHYGPIIPRTTLRYAIERFDKEKRKRLLSRTRKKK